MCVAWGSVLRVEGKRCIWPGQRQHIIWAFERAAGRPCKSEPYYRGGCFPSCRTITTIGPSSSLRKETRSGPGVWPGQRLQGKLRSNRKNDHRFSYIGSCVQVFLRSVGVFTRKGGLTDLPVHHSVLLPLETAIDYIFMYMFLYRISYRVSACPDMGDWKDRPVPHSILPPLTNPMADKP